MTAPGSGSRRRLALVLAIASGVVIADQLSKWWAVRTLGSRTIDLVWTLRLRLVENTGASFSLGQGLGPLIGVAAIVTVALLIWTGRRVETRLAAAGIGLVLGGAVGNLLDRVLRDGGGPLGGGVVDFIDLQWWPVFNVADAGVVVGAALLLVSGLWGEAPSDGAAAAGDGAGSG